MNKTLIFSYLLGLFTLLNSCRTAPDTSLMLPLSGNHRVLFLDSIQASAAIVKDDKTQFFDRITRVDMAIQMKRNLPKSSPRDSILSTYKNFIQEDVTKFSEEEILMLKAIFQEAFALCNKVNPKLFPTEIKLIKTNGKHYGNSVYYTRENCIIIPQNELEEAFPESLLEVMLHEISHIFTRHHLEVAEDLYSLIGFKPIKQNVQIPDSLSSVILHNPDGVNFFYGISLEENNRSLTAIPIIRSNKDSFQVSMPIFYQYLQFDLFEIQPIEDGYQLLMNEDGQSTLDWNQNASFHQQITNNTDYIIHPDEIIADNFMFLMLSQNEKTPQKTFSESGQQLQQKIKQRLEQL